MISRSKLEKIQMSVLNASNREYESSRPACVKAGFTLIETSIAMLVMMVIGLGATSLFFFSIRNNAGGSERSQAMAVAQQRLEELRSVGFHDPKLAIGQSTSTVVIEGVSSGSSSAVSSYGSGGGVQLSGGGAMTSMAGSTSSSKSGKSNRGPGGGDDDDDGDDDDGDDNDEDNDDDEDEEGGGGGSSGGRYKVLLDVEGVPGGTPSPAQKRITVTVTPENGYGASSWINRNPVVIIIHRSNPASGPYRL